MYEEEGKHFFHDLSDVVIEDDVLTRLTTFPTVIVTPHQGKALLMREKALAFGCQVSSCLQREVLFPRAVPTTQPKPNVGF